MKGVGVLTPRELAVLQILGQTGGSNKILAKALDLSEGTIKLHITAVLKKLGAHSRTEAVLLGQQKGLLNVGP